MVEPIPDSTAGTSNVSILLTPEKVELTIESVAPVEVSSLYSGRNFLGGFEFVVLGAGAGFLGMARLTHALRIFFAFVTSTHFGFLP
jgi:hypothetical protein